MSAIQLIVMAILVAASIVTMIMYIFANRELATLQADYDKLDKKYYDKQMECAGLTCDIEAADRDNSKLRMKLSEYESYEDIKTTTYGKELTINEIQNERDHLQLELCRVNEDLITKFQNVTGVEVSSVYVNLDRFQEMSSARVGLFAVVTHVDVDIKV